MKAIILIFTLIINSYTLNAQYWQWVKQAGGSSSDEGKTVTLDNLGNIYLAGSFDGTAIFENDTLTAWGTNFADGDIFLTKYNNSGNMQWIRQAGGFGGEYYAAVKTDNNNNVYVTGHFNGEIIFENDTLLSPSQNDIFVAKYDANGNFQWVRQAGGSNFNDEGRGLIVDNDNNIYITGRFLDTISIGDTILVSEGQYDIFIAKYNSNGDFIWARQAGGLWSDHGYDITIDNQDNLYVTGGYGSHGNPATFGDTTIIPVDGLDIFVAKYDSSGTFIWVRSAGGTGNSSGGWGDYGNSITTDNNNNIYVTGLYWDIATFGDTTTITSYGMSDAFLAKYNSNGDLLWVKGIGGTNGESGSCVKTNNNGDVYLTGSFGYGMNIGDTVLIPIGFRDLYTSKFDSLGNLVWVVQMGGTDASGIVLSVVISDSNEVYITGSFSDTVAFGNFNLNSIGSQDIFLAKLTETDCPLPTATFTFSDSLLAVEFMDSSSGAVNWYWDFGDNNTDTIQNPIHNYINLGYYNVCLTVSNSCGSNTICDSVNVIVTNLQDYYSQNAIKIYPNPFSAYTLIEFENYKKEKHALTLYNSLGQLVRHINNISNGQIRIERDNLTTGLYFFQLRTDSEIIGNRKFIIE